MAAWKIDLLATVPDRDPSQERLSTSWELADALALRGHSVRVLHPSDRPAPPNGAGRIEAVAVPVPSAALRPSARASEFGRSAAGLLEPASDLLVGRDESVGALSRGGRSDRRGALVLLLDDLAVDAMDGARAPPGTPGIRARVGRWLDRRSVRALEGGALARAGAVLLTSELLRRRLLSRYPVDADRVRTVPPAVRAPLEVGSRAEVRKALRVPLDVHAAAFVSRNGDPGELATALEAFRRNRPLFPGARLLVAGAHAPAEPGVMPVGPADAPTRARLWRASDVAMFPSGRDGPSPLALEAMRYGVAALVGPGVELPGVDPVRAVRAVRAEDAGEFASALAELFAVPEGRRATAEAGRAYAEGLTFDRMAEGFERAAGPLVAGGRR